MNTWGGKLEKSLFESLSQRVGKFIFQTRKNQEIETPAKNMWKLKYLPALSGILMLYTGRQKPRNVQIRRFVSEKYVKE